MSSNFLQPCITKPTRTVKYNRPSLVDNIFVNIYDKEIHSGNIIDKITDHLPNFVIIKNMRNKLQTQKFKIRNMKTFKAKYFNDIKELDNLNLYQYKDVNKMCDVYQNKLIEIIDKNARYITLSKKQSTLKLKSWITSSILKSIKVKNLHYKKFLKTQKKVLV